MTMRDMHADLVTFYDEHVRLGGDERKKLADHRDTNLQRLKDGLAIISEEDGKHYNAYRDHCDQGSYAMHTLNQHDANDYDLDHAIIFREADLPECAVDARNHIARAFKATNTVFKKPPEARKNAVTVWYAEGYHVDFALYRRHENVWGGIETQHAGGDNWSPADPGKMKQWFQEQVETRSPQVCAKVKEGQFRRVVRWIKAFTRSRSTWNMPGGMVISKLVEERYQPNSQRDDIAFYDTMEAIHDRLQNDLHVNNPIYPDQELTSTEKRLEQVKNLREKLADVLEQLQVLFDPNCTREQARKAWNCVFKHEFWTQDENDSSDKHRKSSSSSEYLTSGRIVGAPTVIRDTETYG